MFKLIKRKSLAVCAAFMAGTMTMSTSARAGNDFSQISENIIISMQNIPGLLTGVSYIFGMVLGVLGVLKIKDHVENPAQTPLKDGAIRLAAGGALFALPIIFEAMLNTLGDGAGVTAASMNAIEFNVN